MDSCRFGPLKVRLENRLEWRIRHSAKHVHTWRYRIMPEISYPVFERENLTISPYVSDSFYFNLADGIAFDQNRVYGGLAFRVFRRVLLSAYYMRRATRSGRGGDWTGSHVIGTGFEYDF